VPRALLERDVSPNPYDDVPEELAKALEDYLLVSNEDDLLQDPNRMDAVRLLFVQLDEIYDEPRPRSKWVASHRDRSFKVDIGEQGYICRRSRNFARPDHEFSSGRRRLSGL
jgi:hypothetical protein